MKHILLTGATGFIGSHVLDALLKHMATGQLHIVVNTTRSTEFTSNPRLIVHHCDLTEPLKIDVDFDDIIHLAAYNRTHLDRQPSYDNFYRVNVQSVINLVEQLTFKRFILMSTANVYDCSDAVITETCAVGYTSDYERSKLAAEDYCRATIPEKLVVLRCVNVCGPRQKPVALVPYFIRRALAGESLDIFVPENREINLLDVRDVANFIAIIAEQSTVKGTYNVSSEDSIAVYDIAKIILKKAGSSSIIQLQNKVREPVRHVSAAKARDELNWQAHYPIDETISEMIEQIRREQ